MMMTYEGFFSKITDKFAQNKLAKAFVDFLNIVVPELKCYYVKNKKGNSDSCVESNGITVVYIRILPFEEKDLDITVFDTGNKLPELVLKTII